MKRIHDRRTCPELMTNDGWRVFCLAEEGDPNHRYELDAALYAQERALDLLRERERSAS